MEPEGSSPHSQASANCPYPGPAQFSHIPTSHLLDIHPNIIHPSTPRSLQWSLSLRFPHQDPIRPPLLTHTRHMPNPSHSSRFYHPHNIGWGVQITQGYIQARNPQGNWPLGARTRRRKDNIKMALRNKYVQFTAAFNRLGLRSHVELSCTTQWNFGFFKGRKFNDHFTELQGLDGVCCKEQTGSGTKLRLLQYNSWKYVVKF